MTIQLSIRLDPDLHAWLSEHVAAIRPETTLNKYIVYLIEQDRDKPKLVDSPVDYTIQYDEK